MIVIVGSQSFIGQALAERCRARGLEHVNIDRLAGPATKVADIRDRSIADLIPEGATVVHLAAVSRDADCRADPALAFDINVAGTLNVAAAARKRKAQQLIFASSEWVYGEVQNDELQNEERPIDITRMQSEYAVTKLIGEQSLRLSRAELPVTVLRFGIVYGPREGNWSAVESLFHAVLTKDEIQVGSRSTARRFIHVFDIAEGILAARTNGGFEIFNLSGDQPITLGDVIDTSCRVLGRAPRVVERDPAQVSVRNPDNAKARAQLSWRPAIGIESGLETLRDYFSRAGKH